MLVGPLGFVSVTPSSYLQTIVFSRQTTLFSFSGNYRLRARLAGDEKVERKETSLPSMRQQRSMEIWIKRFLDNELCMQKMWCILLRTLAAASRRTQVSNLWQSKTTAQRSSVYKFQRKNPALALQRVWSYLLSWHLKRREKNKIQYCRYSACRPRAFMSKMQLPKGLERRQLLSTFRGRNQSTTLSLPKMWASLFKKRAKHSLTISFFFKEAFF